ncbi:MAG: radical SAM protein [Candidatus Gorgyraea atricola]|nr:radical SAM protein [Candidatus Gorgyraea atricola]
MTANKEIILVNLPPARNYKYENSGSLYPATGIMVIGAILKKRKFSVKIVDGALIQEYEKRVLESISERTMFVGFSAMTSQIVMGYELAKKIKEKWPRLYIVFGGVHSTLYPEQTVSNPYIDIAVINEGSRTVLEIIEHIEGHVQLEAIKGISFCDSEGNVKINIPRDLDDISEIPHFDFELLDLPRYLNARSVYERELNLDGSKNIRLMPILTGLGCCFRCAFCINVILKRHYRARSAASIVEEIKRLQSRYGANAFLFLDEDFCINKKRLADFIKLAKDENIKFLARIWARVSYFRQDSFKNILPDMEKIGIKSIAMGAESGSQKMLDYLHKDIKCEDIKNAAVELSKFNITPRFSFMTGMDGENKDDTISTYRLCGELLKINPITDIAGPFTFRYYPGSPIFNQGMKRFNISLSKSIEDWKDSLNDDGSLIVDTTRLIWPGFSKYSESMNSYINIYLHKLNRLSLRNRFLVKIIRKLVLWRLMHGEHCYAIDYYTLRLLAKLETFLLKLYRSIYK